MSIIEVSGTIAASSILSLYKTPILFVASESSEALIVVNRCILRSIYGTTAYLYGSAFYLQYGDSFLALAAETLSNGLIVGTNANRMGWMGPLSNPINDTDACLGQSIYLSCDAPFTQGDGTLDWCLSYEIYSF